MARSSAVARMRSQRSRNVRTGGFVGMERKFYDTARAAVALTAPADASGGEVDPGTVNCISAPAQGDGESNRDGRKIHIKSVHIKGNVFVNTVPTATDTPGKVFVAIVQDTQTNGAQLNSEDVYTNPSASTNLATMPFRNLQYSSRFKVLATKVVTADITTAAYNGTSLVGFPTHKTFEIYKNVDIPVTFSNTTAGVANVTDNSLHVIAYCQDTTSTPYIQYNARIRFVG